MPLSRLEVLVTGSTGSRYSRQKTLAFSLGALQLSLRQRYIHDSLRISLCKDYFNVSFQGVLLDAEVLKLLDLV